MPKNNRTLYKYMSVKHAADAIRNQRLKMDDGSSYNDPFELIKISRDGVSISAIKGLHILCLCGGYRNKLLWSHYADSHKGICLTIQIPAELVYPVCYTSERLYDDSNIDEIINKGVKHYGRSKAVSYDGLTFSKKCAYIKDRKWDYEKENRVIFDSRDEEQYCNIVHYDPAKALWFMSVEIKNIYLGVNFSMNKDEERKSVIDACKEKNISIRQMRMSKSGYSLEVGPIALEK